MNLLDIMDCQFHQTVYSDNTAQDDDANTELYLNLLARGKRRGFTPVLMRKDAWYYHYIFSEYGYEATKDNYPKVVNQLIKSTDNSCFEVLYGRLIYNYYLEGCEFAEDVKSELERLNPPATLEYSSLYNEEIKRPPFSFSQSKEYRPAGFQYDNYIFALIPANRAWEVMAWVPTACCNSQPDADHQVALAKYLYEKAGAIPAFIESAVVQYYVPVPLADKSKIEPIASLLMAADEDIYQDFECSVMKVRGNSNFVLWWD